MSGSFAFWLNRPHDGLRDPEHPGGRSPRTRSTPPWSRLPATCRSRSPGDYIELLPAAWRAVNAYGIKLRPGAATTARS